MHRLPAILLLLLLPWLAGSQDTFQKLITSPVTGLGGVALAETPDGGYVIGGISAQVIKLNNLGEVEWGRRVDSSGVFDVKVLPDGELLLSTQTKDAQALMNLSPVGQLNWVEHIGKPTFLNGNLATSELGILSISSLEVIENPFYVQQRDAGGNLQWNLKIEVPEHSLDGRLVMDYLGNSWLAAASNSTGSFLFNISDNGHPFWALQIPGWRVSDLGVFPNGDIFAAGSFIGSNDIVLMRFLPDGSIIWQKRLQSLTPNTGSSSLSKNGEVLVRTYQGSGLAGLVKIGPDGHLLWARGYPSGNFGLSRPIFTGDGGVAMLVPKPNQQTLAEIVFIKADAQGRVEGCEVPDICPEYEDVQLEISPVSFNSELLSFSENISVDLFPLPLEVTAFCQTVQIPLPDFELADTICAGEYVQPMPLMNEGAQAWEWEFGAGAVPPLLSEQFPQNILFTTPGPHTVRQTVVFGGCRDSFEQVINVLPAPVPNLGADTLICADAPYQLDGTLQGNVTYLWENGSTSPVRTVAQNGTYVLTATDEQCTGVDSVTVRFFSQTWPGVLDNLPTDTLACVEAPLLLDATVEGATDYHWSTGSDSSQALIEAPGLYDLTIFFENCSVSQTFEVVQEQCAARIYLPNVFSPNGDGINDVLIPFGKNAIFENMQVFDRWGGLVYESAAPLEAWDGRVDGKPANVGVYVVLVTYTDAYTGQRKYLSGDVVLVR